MTVVIATYNRSDALSYALRSVRAQTLADWECLVIGDACTDDSEAVVAAFGDPRIRFENLPVNIGDQSGPNNHGCAHARGRFIAFLNHDDLWLPEHLRTCVQMIAETGADLAVPMMAIMDSETAGRQLSLAPSQGYDPRCMVPASMWVFRRELLAAVGLWKHRHACFNVPSQDWIFRAWKTGHRIAGVPRLTVIAFPSGSREQAYLRGAAEQAAMWRRISEDPRFEGWLTEFLAAPANPSPPVAPPPPHVPYWRRTPGHWLRTAQHFKHYYGVRWVHWLAPRLGIHPKSVEYFLRYRRRGGFVDALRGWRGLDGPKNGQATPKRPVP